MAAEHRNVHGQKIGIKYFLEKRLKPRPSAWGGDNVVRDGYPVYVQVSVKQQNTKIRSKLNDYVAPEHFDVYLRNDDKRQVMADEKAAITNYILAAKPFENEHFSLSASLHEFTNDEYDIGFVIGKFLKQEFREAYQRDLVDRAIVEYNAHPTKEWQYWAKYEYHPDEDDQHRYIVESDVNQVLEAFDNPFSPYTANLSPRSVFLLIWANAVKDNERVCEMKETYGLPFLRLNQYANTIRQEANRLVTLPLFMSPPFDTLFLEHCGSKQELKSIRAGFDIAMQRHPELLKIAQNALT